MTESKIESKKKPTAAVLDGETAEPVHTIREGAVAASIWKRQSTSGYAYFDFSLSRSWKSMSTNKTGYSKSFFTRNEPELHLVIEKASVWIKEHEQAAQATLANGSEAGVAHDAQA
ncbi:MAG TPA: hypothetical protein VGN12_15465 [Pirellulales bacterium]